MQIFMKTQTRNAARSASFGSKVVDNGKDALKRWGRAVDAKHSQKETIQLKCIKDYRNIGSAKVVQVLKVKKSKLK